MTQATSSSERPRIAKCNINRPWRPKLRDRDISGTGMWMTCFYRVKKLCNLGSYRGDSSAGLQNFIFRPLMARDTVRWRCVIRRYSLPMMRSCAARPQILHHLFFWRTCRLLDVYHTSCPSGACGATERRILVEPSAGYRGSKIRLAATGIPALEYSHLPRSHAEAHQQLGVEWV